MKDRIQCRSQMPASGSTSSGGRELKEAARHGEYHEDQSTSSGGRELKGLLILRWIRRCLSTSSGGRELKEH